MKWFNFSDKKPKKGKYFLGIRRNGILSLCYRIKDEEIPWLYDDDDDFKEWNIGNEFISDKDISPIGEQPLIVYWCYISFGKLDFRNMVSSVPQGSEKSIEQTPLSKKELKELKTGKKWAERFKNYHENGYLRSTENKN